MFLGQDEKYLFILRCATWNHIVFVQISTLLGGKYFQEI